MSAGWWAGVGAAVSAMLIAIVALVVIFAGERSQADACWSAGGVPVQGDSVKGQSVVCLDSSVVIEVHP